MGEKRIRMTEERRKAMLASIKAYFRQEREEDLGDLGALLILDFFMEKLAPPIYNQGLEDAHRFMNEKLEDLYGLQI